MPNYHLYLPTINPNATLLIVHGMAEHQERYQDFAQFLANYGIVVMTFNHLGHGNRRENSSTQPQPLGYIGNPYPHKQMIADVIAHANILNQLYPNLPHFILGHSMGSFITRCVLQTYGVKLSGAIMMGTSAPNAIIPLLIPLTKLLNSQNPLVSNNILGFILNKINNAPFHHEPNLQDFNWLNSNPARVNDYINDPLCGFTFTNNGFYALFSLMQQGVQSNWSLSVPKNLPLLWVSGTHDSIGKMGKGIVHIMKNLQKQGFIDITAYQYAGMRHEILHEDNHKAVYHDILVWLQHHSSKKVSLQ